MRRGLIAVAITTALWLLIVAATAAPLPKGIITLERPAPLFELADMDGQRYTFRRHAAGWRFVHFWASWCGPCRREMPALARALPALRTMGLEVVVINTAESEDTVFEFLAAVAPDLPSLLDSDGSVTEAWRPRGLPATYLVDPAGNIRYLALGGRPWDQPEYLAFLRRLSAAPPAQ